MVQKILYSIVVLIIVALISLSIGWQLGKLSAAKFWQVEIAKKQEEIKALQSALELFYPPLPEEIFSLSGKVVEIKDKEILMEAEVRVNRFPLPEGKEIEKQNILVNVTDQTKITEIDLLAPPPLPGEEPRPEKVLSFEDIKVGDKISVNSEENIKGKKEITASQIQIIKQPSLP